MTENTETSPSATTRTPSDNFLKMVAFSLLVHAIFSTALIMNHGGTHPGGSTQFIDLSMIDPAPQTATAPKPAVAPQPAPAEEPAPAAMATEKTENPTEAVSPAEPQPPTAAPPQTFQQGSLGFGIANGHFGSISDGRTLRDDMREYYLEMLARFNETWWRTRGAEAQGGRGASFLVIVARNGTIVDANLIQTSGNYANDRVMLQALKSAGPLGALPASYEGDFFSAPLRFVAPLNLMNSFGG